MENSPGRTNEAEGASQREPGRAAHVRQPGALQGPPRGGPATATRCKARPRVGQARNSREVESQSKGQSRLPHCLPVRRPDFTRSSPMGIFNVSTTPISLFRPEYSGFEYVVVRDELVIIDPETLEMWRFFRFDQPASLNVEFRRRRPGRRWWPSGSGHSLSGHRHIGRRSGQHSAGSSAKKLPDTLPRGVIPWSKLGNQAREATSA